ncbi:hypothetical protein [Caldimonas brevitalea]|uniref:Uncharacterized protein n=1 Tax=Caldimonas brevitalea TaxID=413882 RepID=A0A0G3BI71_9BURK|nr:hypothetical protein [Caldimonas brevitalea]AKJ29067.1 hypothetical protein AAW51_2376 [Caldimonas brevitalea]
MRSYLTASLCLLFSAHATAAQACPPRATDGEAPTFEESVDSAFEQADSVFIGKVMSTALKPDDADHFLITLKVEKTYKGAPATAYRFELDVRPSPCPSYKRWNTYPSLGSTNLYFASVQAAGVVRVLMTLPMADARATHPPPPELQRDLDTAFDRIEKLGRQGP